MNPGETLIERYPLHYQEELAVNLLAQCRELAYENEERFPLQFLAATFSSKSRSFIPPVDTNRSGKESQSMWNPVLVPRDKRRRALIYLTGSSNFGQILAVEALRFGLEYAIPTAGSKSMGSDSLYQVPYPHMKAPDRIPERVVEAERYRKWGVNNTDIFIFTSIQTAELKNLIAKYDRDMLALPE